MGSHPLPGDQMRGQIQRRPAGQQHAPDDRMQRWRFWSEAGEVVALGEAGAVRR